MPTLHLKLVPTTDEGRNKVILSNMIRSQELVLKSATVLKPNTTNYTDGSIKILLPFLTANQFHSNDRKGFVAIPLDPTTPSSSPASSLV